MALAAFAAGVAAVCAFVAHHGCVDPGPPVSRPEPGTPRAGSCGTVDDGVVRALIVLAAVAIVLAAGHALRRRRRCAVAAAMLVALALLANAVVASSLTFAYTI